MPRDTLNIALDPLLTVPQDYFEYVAPHKSTAPYTPPIPRQAYKKHYRLTHPEAKLFESAKARARERGLPFNITLDDIVIPARCPIDGKPLLSSAGLGRLGPNPRSPTLDCIVPARGYVKGNVAVISHHWNRLKCTMTADDLRRLLRYIEGATHG